MDILALLKERAEDRGGYSVVPYSWCRTIAVRASISPRQVEIAALEGAICPSRYERNMGTIGLAGQIKLLRSCVGVLGCGGLGGYIIEMLARAGVGSLVLIDGDTFSESNLNRQLLCTEEKMGKNKAEAGRDRVQSINSVVEVRACTEYFRDENADALLQGCDLVLDALDNNTSRLSTVRSPVFGGRWVFFIPETQRRGQKRRRCPIKVRSYKQATPLLPLPLSPRWRLLRP